MENIFDSIFQKLLNLELSLSWRIILVSQELDLGHSASRGVPGMRENGAQIRATLGSNHLKLLSYNRPTHDFNQGWPTIADSIDQFDSSVILLQENRRK